MKVSSQDVWLTAAEDKYK